MRFLANSDRLFAVLSIAFASVMYVIIGGMEEPYSPGALAASSYPRLVLFCMILISCLIIIRSEPEVKGRAWTFSAKGLIVIVLTAMYIGLIEIVGFFVLTPVFLILLPVMAGFRRYGMIITSAAVVTAIFYGIFVGVLNIPLPAGILGD
jgi:putative tricarboxylic transport membrane protein